MYASASIKWSSQGCRHLDGSPTAIDVLAAFNDFYKIVIDRIIYEQTRRRLVHRCPLVPNAENKHAA